MESGADKIKVAGDGKANKYMDEVRLEEVSSFKCLGITLAT